MSACMSRRTRGSRNNTSASPESSVLTVERSTRLGLTDVSYALMCGNCNRSNIQNRCDANQTSVGAKP